MFQDVAVEDISNMAVFLGMNGAGKTTFFDVFGFLHDALQTNIRAALARRVPGVSRVEAQETEDGRIILRFQDGNFKDPFVLRFVSDGTNVYLFDAPEGSGEACPALRGRAGKSAVSTAFVRIGGRVSDVFRGGRAGFYFHSFAGFSQCGTPGGIILSG